VNIKNILQQFSLYKNSGPLIAWVLVASFLIPSSVFASLDTQGANHYPPVPVHIMQVVTEVGRSLPQVSVSNVSGCAISPSAGVTNFVQDQVSVNLNNSLNCAPLQVVTMSIGQPISIEKNLQRSSSVVVVRLPESRLQSTLENRAPLQPLSVITIVISFIAAVLYEERKRFAKISVPVLALIYNQKQPLLVELSVWRC